MVNDFKKVEYDDAEITNIKQLIDLILKLKRLLDDYNSFIRKDFCYVENAIDWLANYPAIFPEEDVLPIKKIYDECNSLVDNIESLLDAEKRRILKGKLQLFKQKYSQLYYFKHTKIVGNSIKWSELDAINQSEELKWLRDLKAIKGINSLELYKLDNQILTISRLKCTELSDENLKDDYLCLNCRFPEGLREIKDVNEEIENIKITIDLIAKEWTCNILAEIENYKDNIKLLSTSEQSIIEDIRNEKKIPVEITPEIIRVLNNLFSELTEIEVDPGEFIGFIFSENTVLDYESFSQKLEEYKEKILDSGDKKNIRIKLRSE